MIEQTSSAHRQRWQLGSAATWAVDLGSGTITWQFDQYVATAPVQIIGSYSEARGQWTWAWAIGSVPAPLCAAAEEVRSVGVAAGHTALTTPTVKVDEAGAADLMATAFRLSKATGFYRGPGSDATYFTFGDVTLDRVDGTSDVFRVAVD